MKAKRADTGTTDSRDLRVEKEVDFINDLKDVTFKNKEEFDKLVTQKLNKIHNKEWIKSKFTSKYLVLKCNKCIASKGFSVWFNMEPITLYRKIRLLHTHEDHKA